MITVTDALGTVEFDDYFVILPSFQLWDVDRFVAESGANPGKMVPDGFAYDSGTNDIFLTRDQIRELIEAHVDG